MSPIADFAVPATLQVTNSNGIATAPSHMATINQSETPAPAYSGRTISSRSDDSHRSALKRIAKETLTAIREGGYSYPGVDQDLTEAIKEAISKTVYYSPSSYIKRWASSTKPNPTHSLSTRISIRHITILDAARRLDNIYKSNPFDSGKIGILNVASPMKAGGEFKDGSETQEASIVRSSTLYPALKTDEARQFYKLHARENTEIAAGYYSHSMIYSPNICIFRNDDGNWTYAFLVDVLSCSAVSRSA